MGRVGEKTWSLVGISRCENKKCQIYFAAHSGTQDKVQRKEALSLQLVGAQIL